MTCDVADLDDRTQPGDAGPDQRHGVRVGRIGLAAPAGREDPHPCRELRRDIDHVLADCEESHGDVVADPVAALPPMLAPSLMSSRKGAATSSWADPS